MTYPQPLPERWRPGPGQDPAAPSLARMAAMVRHLPDGNPIERALYPDRGEWSVLHQLVDDSRRFLATALGAKELPPPHPVSPFAKGKPAATGGLPAARAKRLAAAKARADRRKADLERR